MGITENSEGFVPRPKTNFLYINFLYILLVILIFQDEHVSSVFGTKDLYLVLVLFVSFNDFVKDKFCRLASRQGKIGLGFEDFYGIIDAFQVAGKYPAIQEIGRNQQKVNRPPSLLQVIDGLEL